MANKLSTDEKASAVGMLCEGSSIRSVERITGIHRDTVMRLGVRMGEGCRQIDSKSNDNADALGNEHALKLGYYPFLYWHLVHSLSGQYDRDDSCGAQNEKCVFKDTRSLRTRNGQSFGKYARTVRDLVEMIEG